MLCAEVYCFKIHGFIKHLLFFLFMKKIVLSMMFFVMVLLMSCQAQSPLQRSYRTAFPRVATTIEQAIRDSVFPSAQVLILRDTNIIYEQAFGHLKYDAQSPSTTLNTVYDLASLSKVLATTMCLMKLYDEKRFDLDETIASHFPAFASKGKETITIRDMLIHKSGMASGKVVALNFTTNQEYYSAIMNDDLRYKRGDTMVYSDLNFIMLGLLVEKLSGKRLDRYFDSVFVKPLGITRLFYTPHDSIKSTVAPVGYDTDWHWNKPAALVHDPRARFLDGIAGHAGLFGNARSIAQLFVHTLLAQSKSSQGILQQQTIQRFTTRYDATSSRAFGWDTKFGNGFSSSGTKFVQGSYGHTGFTGTSVWHDTTRNLTVILLTNRVFPVSSNTKIIRFRAQFHDVIADEFDAMQK
jgi:CubicO group peptidase (beta-lactamase class C family)